MLEQKGLQVVIGGEPDLVAVNTSKRAHMLSSNLDIVSCPNSEPGGG